MKTEYVKKVEHLGCTFNISVDLNRTVIERHPGGKKIYQIDIVSTDGLNETIEVETINNNGIQEKMDLEDGLASAEEKCLLYAKAKKDPNTWIDSLFKSNGFTSYASTELSFEKK